MTREEKITAGVVAAVIILILLWLRGSSASNSTTVVNENQEGAVYNLGGGDIDIPWLTTPSRRGPIIWPHFDNGGSGYAPVPTGDPYRPTIAGKSTCGCGDGTTAYYQRAPDPVAPAPVIQQLYRVTTPAVKPRATLSFVSSPAPQNGYMNAAGRVTSGQWW